MQVRMSLLTRCPQCQTTFRISEEVLRKAAGQVRCGRCSSIFNAHLELHDSEEAPKPRPAPVPTPPPTPAPTGPKPSEWPQILETALPTEPRLRTVASTPEPAVEATVTPAPPQDEAPLDAERVAAMIAGPEPEPGVAELPVAAELWTLNDVASPPRSRLWTAAAAVAGLVLLVQVAHSFSDVLATRVPLVQNVYAALGVTLVPRWDLDRYEVLGASAATTPGASGRANLVITARIRNRGTLAQPYPQVQLRLLDRWERTVGRRAFAPADYSAATVPPGAMLAPGASVTAELVVVDPGPDAAGFEIDVCVAGATGLRCDGDEVFE
jgi:predicted Zn finger-like uncharacterized protein